MGVKYHLKCHVCHLQFHGADRSKHIREKHNGIPPSFTKVDRYGNPWDGEYIPPQQKGVIRIDHEEEKNDIEKFESTSYDKRLESKSYDIPKKTEDISDESSEDISDDSDDEVKILNPINNYKQVDTYTHPYKPPYTPPYTHPYKQVNTFKEPYKPINLNYKIVTSIDGLNKRLTEVINNFNGHINKLYNEKIDKTDVNDLYKRVNNMTSTIEAMKRTLTEQSRMAGSIYNVYKHTKHRKDKTAKKINKKINNVVSKSLNISHSNNILEQSNKSLTENVLKNINININAQRISIERSYNVLNGLIDIINTIKARIDAHEIRIQSVEKTNDIILKNQLTEEDVIKIVKRILNKEGRKIETEEIIDIIHGGNIDNKEDKLKDNLDKVKDEQNEKLLSKHFKEEMDELINKMRLTKKNELNKSTLKKMKNIIEKHSSMGHLNDIKNYTESLPKNNTKNNKKKAVTRQHLHVVIKNIEVKT
jgi:uncharacterized protein YktA (UPF0223 family)